MLNASAFIKDYTRNPPVVNNKVLKILPNSHAATYLPLPPRFICAQTNGDTPDPEIPKFLFRSEAAPQRDFFSTLGSRSANPVLPDSLSSHAGKKLYFLGPLSRWPFLAIIRKPAGFSPPPINVISFLFPYSKILHLESSFFCF